MREELTHLMKSEFIFFVRPGIEEDMRPLKLSDRDTLSGGLTRQEYDSRMKRLKRVSTIAIAESKAGKHVPMEWRQKWFEDSLPKIEKILTLHSQNFLCCKEMEGHWNRRSTRIKMTNYCKKYTTLF